MIADVGLSFVSGAEGQVEFWGHLPIVLDKRRYLQLIHVEQRITPRLRELQRPTGNVIGQT